MEKKILSIIIPVYNAEKYVDGLLKKFIQQDLKNVEIILIDDGSKDNSLNICNEYAKKSQSVVVYHQENQGASAARNKGIELAQGKYIVFADSDDGIADNYINDICKICEEQQTDLIQFDAYIKKDEEINVRECRILQGVSQLKDYYHIVLNQEVNEPWDKAYRAKIIHKNGIRFDTNMTIGEDVNLTVDFLRFAKTVYVHHGAYYYYERNEAGICSNAKMKHLDDLELLYQNMQRFVDENSLDEEAEVLANTAMLKGVFRTIGLIIQNGESKKNIVAKMDTFGSIKKLLDKKYTEKSVEIRKILLKLKWYRIVAVMVAMKNKR